jgi:hypothetical protein
MDAFKKALAVMQRLKKETADQAAKLTEAAAAVEVAHKAADDARVAAVIDPSPAAIKAATEAAAALDKVLEARDRLEARSGDLEKAIAVVYREMNTLAVEEAKRSKAEAFAAARARLDAARPVLEQASLDAGLIWMSNGDGPSDQIHTALSRYSGIDAAATRLATFKAWDSIIEKANACQQSMFEENPNED